MAHHSGEPFPYTPGDFGELKQKLFTQKEEPAFGATNKFPDGKLNNADEGEIMFGIAESDGRIILNFGKPVSWLGLTKEQAKDFAELILNKLK